METLIQDIAAFCAQNGISETRFGDLALNDKPFVKQVREGRRLWPETERKVRDFMAAYVAPEAQPTPSRKVA